MHTQTPKHTLIHSYTHTTVVERNHVCIHISASCSSFASTGTGSSSICPSSSWWSMADATTRQQQPSAITVTVTVPVTATMLGIFKITSRKESIIAKATSRVVDDDYSCPIISIIIIESINTNSTIESINTNSTIENTISTIKTKSRNKIEQCNNGN